MSLSNPDPFSLQPDLETTRIIELENNKVYVKRDGQFGHWFINLDKGQLPQKYRGAYTGAPQALAAANRWISEKNKTIAA